MQIIGCTEGKKSSFFVEKAKNAHLSLFILEKKRTFAPYCVLLRINPHEKEMKLLIVILLLAAAFILLSVRVILKRNGRFSSQHISQSKTMRERGIHCATSQDREARRKAPTRLDPKQL